MPDDPSAAAAAPDRAAVLVPTLVLRDPDAAADFYGLAFGAERHAADGAAIVLALGGAMIRLVRADRGAGLLGADSFGGAPVRFLLLVADLDAAVARARAHGATVLRSPGGKDGGQRNALLRDPFLHVWDVAERGA